MKIRDITKSHLAENEPRIAGHWSTRDVMKMPEQEQQELLRTILDEINFVAAKNRMYQIDAVDYLNLSLEERWKWISPKWDQAGMPLPGTPDFMHFSHAIFFTPEQADGYRKAVQAARNRGEPVD